MFSGVARNLLPSKEGMSTSYWIPFFDDSSGLSALKLAREDSPFTHMKTVFPNLRRDYIKIRTSLRVGLVWFLMMTHDTIREASEVFVSRTDSHYACVKCCTALSGLVSVDNSIDSLGNNLEAWHRTSQELIKHLLDNVRVFKDEMFYDIQP